MTYEPVHALCSHWPDNTHTVLITVPSCRHSTRVSWQLLSGVQLVFQWWLLLTNFSLVIKVKLSIFICKTNTHKRLLLTMSIHSQHPLMQHFPAAGILHVSKTVSTSCMLISLSYTLQTADLARGQTQTADNDRCVSVWVCCFLHVCQQKKGKGQLSGAACHARQIGGKGSWSWKRILSSSIARRKDEKQRHMDSNCVAEILHITILSLTHKLKPNKTKFTIKNILCTILTSLPVNVQQYLVLSCTWNSTLFHCQQCHKTGFFSGKEQYKEHAGSHLASSNSFDVLGNIGIGFLAWR